MTREHIFKGLYPSHDNIILLLCLSVYSTPCLESEIYIGRQEVAWVSFYKYSYIASYRLWLAYIYKSIILYSRMNIDKQLLFVHLTIRCINYVYTCIQMVSSWLSTSKDHVKWNNDSYYICYYSFIRFLDLYLRVHDMLFHLPTRKQVMQCQWPLKHHYHSFWDL